MRNQILYNPIFLLFLLLLSPFIKCMEPSDKKDVFFKLSAIIASGGQITVSVPEQTAFLSIPIEYLEKREMDLKFG